MMTEPKRYAPRWARLSAAVMMFAFVGTVLAWVAINAMTGCGEGGYCTWPIEHKGKGSP